MNKDIKVGDKVLDWLHEKEATVLEVLKNEYETFYKVKRSGLFSRAYWIKATWIHKRNI